MNSQRKKKRYPTKSVSFPDEALLAAAKMCASAQHRSLSNYINGLIRADLKERPLQAHEDGGDYTTPPVTRGPVELPPPAARDPRPRAGKARERRNPNQGAG